MTYNRDNRRARDFEVLVDGQRLAVEKFPFDSESRFFDREYALPEPLVKGKHRITVERPGYFPYDADVTAEGTDPILLKVALVPIPD